MHKTVNSSQDTLHGRQQQSRRTKTELKSQIMIIMLYLCSISPTCHCAAKQYHHKHIGEQFQCSDVSMHALQSADCSVYK